MGSLQWTSSNAVFVTEIDDEHQEIFAAVASFQEALAHGLPDIETKLQHLVAAIAGHFAHEERLMRAARYSSLRWHKKAHDAAHKRVGKFAARIQQGDTKAGSELIEYLTTWLDNHTRLADRMMGAYLRNHQRCMWKVTFQAGTRPLKGRAWVRANGDAFDPQMNSSGSSK